MLRFALVLALMVAAATACSGAESTPAPAPTGALTPIPGSAPTPVPVASNLERPVPFSAPVDTSGGLGEFDDR
ncbi:MAG: hypothetical protein V3S18_06820, partial [Dehalococcoidia bacterium]